MSVSATDDVTGGNITIPPVMVMVFGNNYGDLTNLTTVFCRGFEMVVISRTTTRVYALPSSVLDKYK